MKKAYGICAALLGAAALTLFAVSCSRGGAPLIGISPCYDGHQASVPETYVTAVRKAGGIPVLLPPMHSGQEALQTLEALDGLVMTGGEDIDPARYAQSVWNGSVSVNAARDSSDFLTLGAARALSIPVLGICRGHQAVGVLLGGTLWQDLPTQLDSSPVAHRQSESGDIATHMIYLVPGTHLHALLGVDSIAVNSFHHQAVRDIPAACTVSAVAADGVVEAFEGPGVMCVQFHPEKFIAAGNTALLPIVKDFVREAAGR